MSFVSFCEVLLLLFMGLFVLPNQAQGDCKLIIYDSTGYSGAWRSFWITGATSYIKTWTWDLTDYDLGWFGNWAGSADSLKAYRNNPKYDCWFRLCHHSTACSTYDSIYINENQNWVFWSTIGNGDIFDAVKITAYENVTPSPTSPTPDPTPSPTIAPTAVETHCTDYQECIGDDISANEVRCDSFESCRATDILFGSYLYCSGEESCDYSDIIGHENKRGSCTGWTCGDETHLAYFDGPLAAKNADIIDVTNIFGRGFLSLYQTTIDSGDLSVMYLELTGNMVAWNSNIYCRENANCEIKCEGTGCFYVHLYCYGTCTITCDPDYCLFEPTDELAAGSRRLQMIDNENTNTNKGEEGDEDEEADKPIDKEQLKLLASQYEMKRVSMNSNSNPSSNTSTNTNIIDGIKDCWIFIFGLLCGIVITKLCSRSSKPKNKDLFTRINTEDANLHIDVNSN